MRRLLALTALLALPGSAEGAVRIGDAGDVHAITVTRGAALAVVDSGDRATPFSLVRSRGSGVSSLGGFGVARAEYPAVSADAIGRTFVAYGLPVSGGAALTVQRAPAWASQGFGDPLPEVVGTGPGRLAADAGGAAVLAYPDRDGNAALTRLPVVSSDRAIAPPPEALSSTGPFRRHLPLDVELADEGELVLDLIQERGRSELRVLGPGAPPSALLSVPALRHFPARMAVEGDRIAVGYLSGGRAYLARARLGGSWSRRRLAGQGGGDGAPAPMFASGGAYVAYSQRVRRPGARTQREIFLFGPSGTRRLTRSAGDERDPVAAAGPDGAAYVAWTRREPRRGPVAAFLERVR